MNSDSDSEIAALRNQVYVLLVALVVGQDPYKRLKTALKAEIDEDAWASLYSTTSRGFPKPETGKIAVKVINDYGDEVMKVFEV